MPKPLTPEQLAALRSVPLGEMPNKLAIAITLAGASQVEIFEETGYALSNVSRLKKGRIDTQQITIDTARKFALFFGCAIEDLFPAREAA